MREEGRTEGTRLIESMRARLLYRPTVTTVSNFKPDRCTPAYAFGITNKVDGTLDLLFDILDRSRG